MKPVSLRDIARAYLRDQEVSELDQKLLLSHFVEHAERALSPSQPTNVEQLGVIDRERGWRLTDA